MKIYVSRVARALTVDSVDYSYQLNVECFDVNFENTSRCRGVFYVVVSLKVGDARRMGVLYRA